jgi:hypothetical protein
MESFGASRLTKAGAAQSERLDTTKRLAESVEQSEQKKFMKQTRQPKAKPAKLSAAEVMRYAKQQTAEDKKKLTAEKARVMRMCGRYKQKFGEKYGLTKTQWKDPAVSAPIEEWQAHLDSLKSEIASKNAVPTFQNYWQFIARGIQTVYRMQPEMFIDPLQPGTHMDLTNLDQVLTSPYFFQQIDDEMNEIIIQYPFLFESGPIRRLLSATANVVLTVNMKNKSSENVKTEEPETNSSE